MAVRDAVGEVARQGQSWWNLVTQGTVDPEVLAGEGEENVELKPREGPPLVLAVRAEDGEHPNVQGGGPALKLQRRLTELVDWRIGDSLSVCRRPGTRTASLAGTFSS